ncbi:MAG: hypothetical protein ABSA59_25165 [Terriglobia bacterium]
MLLMQRMEDSSLRQLWRLTMVRIKVRTPQSSIANRQSTIDNHQGAVTLRDVKNEDRPGYVYENTGDGDKMSSEKHGFLHENAPIAP